MALDINNFWIKIYKSPTCWIWIASRTNKGYGQFWVEGKYKKAHRFSYELKFGPIPHGKELDHLCRIRACVNPDHLEVVDRPINIRRGLAAKLTDTDVSQIRDLYAAKIFLQEQIGLIYGVGQDEISRIVNLKRWK